jgi:hypothetical protein
VTTDWRFPIMIAVSLLLYAGVLRVVLGRAAFRRRRRAVALVAVVVVVGGMLIGKYGATLLALPWWIYYPVPAALTLVLAPVVFRFDSRRTVLYLLLAIASAPFIHAAFSFLLGWGEYMPFWPIPSARELLTRS